MLAKDLAEILLKNPDAQVGIEAYNGGCDPIHEVVGTIFEKSGEKTSVYDGGFCTKKGLVINDIILLKIR